MSYKTKRYIAYISLIVFSILLVLLGILLRIKCNVDDFYSSISISVAASIVAGVVTAFLIDKINDKQQEKMVKDSFHQFAITIIQYSLNFCYSFVTYPIKENERIDPDTNSTMYQLFIDKNRLFLNARKSGLVTPKMKKLYSDLLKSMSFYLKNIEYQILGAISKNDVLHFAGNYIFDLRTILADIDKLYDVGRDDFVADQIANIIEELYEIDFIKTFFDMPISKNEDVISQLYVKKSIKNNSNN